MGIDINGKTYETDEEGYLINLAEWDEAVANVIAKGENVDVVLEALARGLTQKMLHGTFAELRGTADEAQRAQVAQTVSRLFLRQSPRHPSDDTPH